MAAKKKRWSYTAGEKGRNWVRAYCKGCPDRPVCRNAREHTGGLYLEWMETVIDPETGRPKQKRPRVLIRGVSDTREASKRADQLAAELAEIKEAEAPPTTLAGLIGTYLKEVTPGKKSSSKRDHDGRAARLWRAFFDMQPEPNRRSERSPASLDRVDWDRFIRARRAGTIPGWGPVRDRQVQYDLVFMTGVLNWAVGAGYLETNPWAAQVRRAQGWEQPRELNPNRPAMTDEIRSGLVAHSPHWQFPLALTLGRYTVSRNSSVRHLRWSDIDLERGVVRWRGEADKTGREVVVPLDAEAVAALRAAPSRGIGEAWVFPSETDPTKPTSRDTFQTWLRRAKARYLKSITDPIERARKEEQLRGLGYHGEKRAGVRDPIFRALPPKVQEVVSRTAYETLKSVYDEVTVDDIREAVSSARRQVGG